MRCTWKQNKPVERLKDYSIFTPETKVKKEQIEKRWLYGTK